jgi:hypothetical protein
VWGKLGRHRALWRLEGDFQFIADELVSPNKPVIFSRRTHFCFLWALRIKLLAASEIRDKLPRLSQMFCFE